MYRKKIFSWISIIGLFFLLSCGSGDDLQIIFLPPNVLEKSPIDGGSNVPLNAPIIITFNQDIEPSSLNDLTTFFLTGPSGSVSGTITYSASDLSATLQPNQDLEPNEKSYTVTVTKGIQSIHGVALGNPHSWSFTTGKDRDTEAPIFSGLDKKPKIKNSGTITLSWDAATDNLDQSDQIVYEICFTLDVGEFCPDFFDNANLVEKRVTNPGVTTIDVTGLFPGIQYFFLVRARDRAGNLDQNREEQSAIIDINQGRLYASNAGASEVLVFDNPTALNGDVQADAKIRTKSGTLGSPNGLFVDKTNDRLYVANFLANSIAIYENVSSFPSTGGYPSRIISGTSTTLNGPTGIYVDLNDANGTLYVANVNSNTISVFHNASQISGNVVPDKTISGDKTLIKTPLGLIVDSNNLYVASSNNSTILIFLKANLQNGLNDSPPDGEIKGSNTNLSGPIGLALSSSHLFVGNFGSNSISLFDWTEISLCTLGTSCNLTPSKIIIGNSTGLDEPRGILISGNRLYVSNGGNNLILVYNLDTLFGSSDAEVNLLPSVFPQQGSALIVGPRGLGLSKGLLYVASQDSDSVLAFNVGAPHVNTPVLKIESLKTVLANPLGAYFNTTRNELYVTNFSDNSIMVFESPHKIGNNYSPSRVVRGNLTQLNGPAGIFVDEKKDKLFVVNFSDNTILVFGNASTLSGNVPPDQRIGGFFTNIFLATGIFVGPDKNGKDMLYVLNRGISSQNILPAIIIIDLSNPSFIARAISGPDTGLFEPIGMSIDLTNDLLYVTNRSGEPSIAGGNILVYEKISDSGVAISNYAPARTIQFHNRITTPGNFMPIRPNGIAVQNLSPSQNRVYVANEGTVPSIFPGETGDNPIPPSVIIFEDKLTSSGDIRYEPSGIIQVGNQVNFKQDFSNRPYGVSVDSNSDTIHVTDFRANSLFIFSDVGQLPSGQTASLIPSAEIPISMRGPRWLALDLGGDELFVSSFDTNSIMSFRNVSNITGDAIPLWIIRGKNSKIKQPQGILSIRNQDTNRLFVANEATRSILVFDDVSSARGDTAPTFEIKSTAFNFSELRGLAFSKLHDLLYVADKKGKIYIFENVSQLTASSDTSDLTPILTLENSSMDQPIGLYVQEVGLTQNDDPSLAGKNRLYVSDFGYSGVLVFDLEIENIADGTNKSLSSTMVRTIQSALPVKFSPVGIFVHEGLDHLYVSSIPTVEGNQEVGESSILVFDKASVSEGIVTPVQHIVGSQTGLQSPFGIVVTSFEFLPDFEKTRVVANPSMVAADGIEESTITVTALDAMNNPFPGVSIVLSSDRGNTDTITQATTITDSNGQVTGTVSSNSPGEAIIHATVSGLVRVENTATITFLETQASGN